MSKARDEQVTRPYEFTAAELRRQAEVVEAAAVDLLRVALDLRKIADSIDEGGAKRLTE